jgi:hypothetical protein
MDIPHYVYRDDGIYGICPEMKEIDAKIGPYFGRVSVAPDLLYINNIYTALRANCSSIEEMFKSPNGHNLIARRVQYLTQAVESMLSPLSNTEAFALLEQKLSILESTYSNLISETHSNLISSFNINIFSPTEQPYQFDPPPPNVIQPELLSNRNLVPQVPTPSSQQPSNSSV